ncbi:MAG: GumC family protein [Syntrophothermus sp.]
MVEKRGFEVLDYFVLMVKHRKLLLVSAILIAALSYTAVFFLMEPQYDSTAVVIPSEESQLGGLSAIMKGMKDLPFGLGGSSKTAETDLFNTIIQSRSTLEKVIHKFDLEKDYKLKSMEKTVKQLRENVKTETTDDNAYKITVRANSAKKAADMVNYILELLNETVININVKKSSDNRQFLEQRYNEIKNDLSLAEDSLQIYQERSGLLEAKEQTRDILETYSKLEADVMTKRLELKIMEKVNDEKSPKLDLMKTQLNEYEKQLNQMKNKGEGNGVFLALNSLPQKGKKYLRYYRDVQVYSTILEFLVPMYEQAKFDERKSIPVLQVIDYGVPAEKKSFPPRTVLVLVITLGALMLIYIYLLIRENRQIKSSEKLNYIKRNIFSWSEK